jgi:hypothetical protein
MSPRWETKFESNKTAKSFTFQQRATQLPCLERDHEPRDQQPDSQTEGKASFASTSPDPALSPGPGSLETLRYPGHEVDEIVL